MPVPILLMVRELGIGGCERDLTKVAIGLDRSRFEPHVGCFISEGLRSGELRAHGIPIVRFHVPSVLSMHGLRGAQALRAYLKRHAIQVVHAFDAPMDIFAVPIARASGTPVVISSNLSYRELVNRKERLMLRLSDRAAHMVVVNSKAVLKELIEIERVPATRTFLSYNGVDLRAFQPEPRIRKVFPDASVIVGAVCALRPEKRLDLLLDALARVKGFRAGLRLLIVGSGPMLGKLEQQAAELGIREDCHFEPSKTDVAEWMRSIDVFVNASESESFPNSLLEAMACGCCVVGSRVGGIPELVVEGDSGLLFERKDAQDLALKLQRVIVDDDLRSRMAERAILRAQQDFSIEAAVDRLQNLYTRLLNRAA
jgi:glycosyltransferase involved in cell wall biosynthesis